MIEQLLSAARQGDGDAIRSLVPTVDPLDFRRPLPCPPPSQIQISRAPSPRPFHGLTVASCSFPYPRTERKTLSIWRRTG